MHQWVFIAIGGACGALARYSVGSFVANLWPAAMPIATLFVNVLGSLLMGVLFSLIVEHEIVAGEWRSVLMVGFLGAFTTFSTFSLETFTLLERGEFATGLIYAATSVIVCVVAAALGVIVTRSLL